MRSISPNSFVKLKFYRTAILTNISFTPTSIVFTLMRKGYIYSIRCGVDKFALGTKQYSTPVMAFCKLCFDGFLYVCSRMSGWLMIVK